MHVGDAAHVFCFPAAGGTASGKTTVCDLVKQRLNDQCVVMLSQDSFYRSLTEEELKHVAGESACLTRMALCVVPSVIDSLDCESDGGCPADYDFDSPNACDHEELVKCMQDLQVPLLFQHPPAPCIAWAC
jgi:hypothetical protein